MVVSILALSLHFAQAQPLTKLIEHCPPLAARQGGCGDLDKPVWKRFVSATGAVSKVDVNLIQRTQDRGVVVPIYTSFPNTNFDMRRLHQYYFNCRGQWRDLDTRMVAEDIPHQSVLAAISKEVCALARQSSSPR